MKYTIEGFYQKRLIQLKLDAVDSVLLRHIVDFYNTGTMKKRIINGKKYVWIYYSSIINELPILGIEKRALSNRLMKFVNCGLMEKQILKDKDGTFSYYHINPDILTSLTPHQSTNDIQIATRCNDTDSPVDNTITPKDLSTINPSTKNNIPPEIFSFATEFQKQCVERFGRLAPSPSNSLIMDGAITLDRLIRLDGFSFDYIVKVLTWAATDSFWEKNIRSLSTLRGKSKNNGLQKFQNIATAYESKKTDQQKGDSKHNGFSRSYYTEPETFTDPNELF